MASAVVVIVLGASHSGGGEVTVHAPRGGAAAPRRAVARDFLGLSFENAELGEVARDGRHGDLVRLLRSLGPGVLRFGGTSADTQTAWQAAPGPLPRWATAAVTPKDLRGLAALARATGWRVMLTVNLGHYDPAAAAAEVRAASRALGASLLAVQIGNEPDAFPGHHLRAASWSIATYEGQVSAYRRAIAASAPGVALAGPDAVNPRTGRPWLLAEAARQRPALLTVHYYPLGRCGSTVPTIAGLLDPALGTPERATLARLRATARRTGRPVRLDETNNVACGGQPGVSDTFASALWGLDYLVRVMAAGLEGVNLHGDLAHPSGYAPLAPATAVERGAGRLRAQPEWYALLAASRLRGDRVVGATEAPADLRGSLTVLARPDGGEDVVVVNLASPGQRPTVIRVAPPAGFRSGTVLRLTAPSPDARTGVTLGAGAVAPEGTWRPRALPRAIERRGFVVVSVPPSSALVLTLRTGAHARSGP